MTILRKLIFNAGTIINNIQQRQLFSHWFMYDFHIMAEYSIHYC